jgi:hypothetical protein
MGRLPRLLMVGVFVLLSGIYTHAQETRGSIAGTVHDPQGVIPGATVKVTNVNTGVTQPVITNERGYFEASLLVAGSYQVTVEMPGFKTLNRAGLTLAVGQQVMLDLPLEVGTIEETITVTGDAPLLETSAVKTGLNISQRQLQDLPNQANQPVLLARFAPGMSARPDLVFVIQGQVQGPSQNATPLGGVGGNEYSIDGATNAGINRQMAISPNGDMIQEMRIESTSFTASVGHGTGAGISMMTRAGTNTPRGTVNYQYWTNKLNPANPFRKAIFAQDPSQKATYEAGRSHNISTTFGGPLSIPRIIDGHDKLFMFLNYSFANDSIPGSGGGTRTLPRSDPGHNQIAGDFSDLLKLPNSAQYQIYDPLTTRPDPARPGHVIRDPFPNNIVPADRINNPLYRLITGWLPQPNQNPTSSSQQPINNFLPPATPYHTLSWVWGSRVDYNLSEKNRMFFRGSGNRFYENNTDWMYQTARGIVERNLIRSSWSGAGTYTHLSGQTVIDGQLAVNRFAENLRHLKAMDYGPAAVGLPSYLQDFCASRNPVSCQLPVMAITGYTTIGGTAGGFSNTTNYQGQLNLSQVRGAHTLRAGLDMRLHQRLNDTFNTPQGQFTFDNTYTRKADDTTVSPAATLGLSWAAFMLGVPTNVTADRTAKSLVTSPYTGTFFQDTWRMGRSLTMSAGLRYEYERGIRERSNQMIVNFDPNASLSIASIAQAAYAAAPIPELAPSAFKVAGGPVYADASGQSGSSWAGHSMWMPRVSSSWSLNGETVLQGGYGLYYDTLNASNFSPNQNGYSATTTSVASVDFGQTWLGDPRNGSMILNPFPVRADGTRFDSPIGSSLGADSIIGTAFSAENPNREPARVQRWRASVQRQLSKNISIEVAYNGSFADHVDASIRQDYLPEQFYNGSNVRDLTQQNLLNANVANPFFIGNFAALKTSNPTLYSRMAGNAFFTSATIQRNRLLRPFPQYAVTTACNATLTNCFVYGDLPLGKTRAKSIEISFSRRFANGFNGAVIYTGTRAEQLTTVEEYDRAPWLWQTSQDARPHRLVGNGLLEFPFGRNKPMLNNGGVLASILGGWQMGSTFEYQPGALLEWPNNIFFYGNLKDITVAHPTLDRWFNVDAGFERDPAKVPASFQKRAFPFRIDGVRAQSLMLLNLNLSRNIALGRRTLQLRVDAVNALNRAHYAAPNLDPTSTQFGQVTAASGTVMRFVTFVTKLTF